MTFTTMVGTDGCIIEQVYERDEYGNVSGGAPRLVTELQTVRIGQAPYHTSRFAWKELVPIEHKEADE